MFLSVVSDSTSSKKKSQRIIENNILPFNVCEKNCRHLSNASKIQLFNAQNSQNASVKATIKKPFFPSLNCHTNKIEQC